MLSQLETILWCGSRDSKSDGHSLSDDMVKDEWLSKLIELR